METDFVTVIFSGEYRIASGKPDGWSRGLILPEKITLGRWNNILG